MKKRFLIGLILALLLFVFLLYYVTRISVPKHVVYDELSSIVPAMPLAYVQCSHLKTRLKELSQSNRYRQFLQSAFVQQLQTTVWWQNLSSSFKEFLNSIVIDPMRIIGTDLAVGIYKAEEGEVLPRIIVVSKIDQVAKIAERLLYVFDRFSGQVGLNFVQDVEGIPVYMVEQPEMLLPLYYAIIDDLGMLSTSLSLLKNTISLAVGKAEYSVNTSSFRQNIHNIPQERFVTSYFNPFLIVNELKQNELLQTLELSQESVLEILSDFPSMTIHLDTSSGGIILETELFRTSGLSEFPDDYQKSAHSEAEDIYPRFPDNTPKHLPVIGAFYRKRIHVLLQRWREFFPQQE